MHANSRLHEEHFSPCKAILKAEKEAARKKQILKGIEQGEKTVNTSMFPCISSYIGPETVLGEKKNRYNRGRMIVG